MILSSFLLFLCFMYKSSATPLSCSGIPQSNVGFQNAPLELFPGFTKSLLTAAVTCSTLCQHITPGDEELYIIRRDWAQMVFLLTVCTKRFWFCRHLCLLKTLHLRPSLLKFRPATLYMTLFHDLIFAEALQMLYTFFNSLCWWPGLACMFAPQWC